MEVSIHQPLVQVKVTYYWMHAFIFNVTYLFMSVICELWVVWRTLLLFSLLMSINEPVSRDKCETGQWWQGFIWMRLWLLTGARSQFRKKQEKKNNQYYKTKNKAKQGNIYKCVYLSFLKRSSQPKSVFFLIVPSITVKFFLWCSGLARNQVVYFFRLF